MSFHAAITFLRELNKNNSKEWMDEHRDEYEQTKAFLIGWIEALNKKLANVDDDYCVIPGKDALTRINNNLLYHSDLPTYKDHFGIALDSPKDNGSFYLHIGLNGSFIGGGYHRLASKILSNIRDTIADSGDQLQAIITQKSFAEFFTVLEDADKLKTAPQGFSQDHEYIELLRLKSYTVKHSITQKEIMSDDFTDIVIDAYKKMRPFLDYLNKAAKD
ncbi:MAG: DUF2461 domain-containing protein [Cyanobacteria bacterium J06627_28]